METRRWLSVYSCTNENKIRSVILTWSPSEEEKTLVNRGKGFLKGMGEAKRWRKTHDRDNNGEAARSRGYAQWQRARHCQSGVNCQPREGGPSCEGWQTVETPLWQRERERDRFALHPRFQGMIFTFAYSSIRNCELFNSRIVQKENYNYSYLSRSIPSE